MLFNSHEKASESYIETFNSVGGDNMNRNNANGHANGCPARIPSF